MARAGAARVRSGLRMVGRAGSVALAVWKAMGLPIAGEAFADRAYEAGGELRPRSRPDALLTDPDQAAAQAERLAREGVVIVTDGNPSRAPADTLGIHADTPGAERIAQAVRARLERAGIRVERL